MSEFFEDIINVKYIIIESIVMLLLLIMFLWRVMEYGAVMEEKLSCLREVALLAFLLRIILFNIVTFSNEDAGLDA